jgi:hypothetical protein
MLGRHLLWVPQENDRDRCLVGYVFNVWYYL